MSGIYISTVNEDGMSVGRFEGLIALATLATFTDIIFWRRSSRANGDVLNLIYIFLIKMPETADRRLTPARRLGFTRRVLPGLFRRSDRRIVPVREEFIAMIFMPLFYKVVLDSTPLTEARHRHV